MRVAAGVVVRNAMAEKLSISQLNKLGERLRKGPLTDDDIRALDAFRLSFANACDEVIRALLDLGLQPSSRPAKTTPSIMAKLNRERGRLSRMQDIAGCRVVVENVAAQDRILADIVARFPGAQVVDRRLTPSHGYRAVHVIVRVGELHVEIQVRTVLQHSWAAATEALSDSFGRDLKYGGGPENIRTTIATASQVIKSLEYFETVASELREDDTQKNLAKLMDWVRETVKRELQELAERTTIPPEAEDR